MSYLHTCPRCKRQSNHERKKDSAEVCYLCENTKEKGNKMGGAKGKVRPMKPTANKAKRVPAEKPTANPVVVPRKRGTKKMPADWATNNEKYGPGGSAGVEFALPADTLDRSPALPEDLMDWHDVKPLVKDSSFGEAVLQRQKLVAQIAMLKTQMEECRETIQVALEINNIKSVAVSHYRVTLVEKAGSKRLSRPKLIKLGVDPELIDQATTVGEPTSFPTVNDFTKQKAGQRREPTGGDER